MNRIGKYMTTAFFACCMLFLLTGCGGGTKSFSARGAVLVTTEGYDGVGTLQIAVDAEELGRIIGAANPKITPTQLTELIKTFEVTPSADKDLSNGQEVAIRVRASSTLLEQLKLTLAEESWSYTVADLKPLEEIDPFEYVEVDITGISPNLSVKVTPKRVNERIDAMRYYVNGEDVAGGRTVTGFSIGDSVELKVATEEANVMAKGFRFTAKEKSYPIDDNHDKFITSPDELDDAAMARMTKEAKDLWLPRLDDISSDYTPGNILAHDDLEYVGAVALITKDNSRNVVDLVFRSEVRNSGKADAEEQPLDAPVMVYFPVQFLDVIRYADGTVDFSEVQFNSDVPRVVEWSWGNRISGYTDTTMMMTHLVRQWTADWNYEMDAAMQELFDAR